jgi:hypothetical protein
MGLSGRGLFFAPMGLLIAVGLYTGAAGLIGANEPVYRGTFRETHCVEGGRQGCRSVGTWLSDDGSTRLTDVYLDGRPSTVGTVEASYQPTGIFNDVDNIIVHAVIRQDLDPFVPWLPVGEELPSWRFSGGAGAAPGNSASTTRNDNPNATRWYGKKLA